MRLGIFPSYKGLGDPIDGDGYPKSRMPDSPPEMYHLSCKSCGKIWWDEKEHREICPFCEKSMKGENE